MANFIEEIRNQVEREMEENHYEQLATRMPRRPVTLKTSFPVDLVWTGPLKTRTAEMKTKNQFYRFTVDPLSVLGEDPEAIITLEVWRHLTKVERHLSTLGELHYLRIQWDGEPIEIAIVALNGGEEARDAHPSILEVGSGLRGFTVGSYPLNLLKVLNNEVISGVSLSKRFLFHVIGIQEILGTMTVEEFSRYYKACDIRNLINFVTIGQHVRRPSIAEAKLNDITIVGRHVGRHRGVSEQRRSEAEVARSRKRKQQDGGKTQRSLSEESPRSSCSAGEKRVTRRALLFEEGSEESRKMWEQIGANNNKEGVKESKEALRAQAAMMGQFSWGSFKPNEFPAAARYAKRMGITTNPPPPPPPVPSGSGSAKSAPTHPADGKKEAKVINIDLVPKDEESDDDSENLDLPLPVPAVSSEDELPPLITLDDSSDVTMQSIETGTSGGSPRAELSRNGFSADDALLQESGSDDSIAWSPFLSKPGGTVVDVSSSSNSSSNSTPEGDKLTREPSVVILEQGQGAVAAPLNIAQEMEEAVANQSIQVITPPRKEEVEDGDKDESVRIVGEKEKVEGQEKRPDNGEKTDEE